jgi:uncharacterized secreted repeat protein (TIGR03808 family)
MNVPRRSLLSAAALLVGGAVTSASSKANKINDLQSDIDKAIQDGGVINLPAGTFATAGLKINGAVQISGIAGHTKLISLSGGPILVIDGARNVSLSGITFGGKTVPSTDELSRSALVMASNSQNLKIENCGFGPSPFSGLRLEKCSGRIVGNQFSKLGDSGVFALDSTGLEISGNDVDDIGNNGIQVWRSDIGEDGSQILNNRISNINAVAGGDGQNGNAIGVYRAGNVMAAQNRITDTAFSAIRFNSASNCQIIGNSVSRAGETAIYVEFAFEGAVVANNVLDGVAFGISMTNYDQGGRMALCTGNIVRNAKRGTTVNAGVSYGIHAEADTLISNNIVENVESNAIELGWGGKCRNLIAQGNIVRQCDRGIAFSVTEGAGKMLMTGNVIDGARVAAIQGMDFNDAKTEDMNLVGAKIPAHVTINNNVITS